MRSFILIAALLSVGCSGRPSEREAKKLSERCIALGGTPQVIRVDNGRLLGEPADVLCAGLNNGENK